MRALKYFNETLYVSESGCIHGVRQVGEYMYQVMDYNGHRLLCKGDLIPDSVIKAVYDKNNVFYKVKDLFKAYFDLKR